MDERIEFELDQDDKLFIVTAMCASYQDFMKPTDCWEKVDFEHFRKLVDHLKGQSFEELHDGDCANQCQTCIRCFVEGCVEYAKELISFAKEV